MTQWGWTETIHSGDIDNRDADTITLDSVTGEVDNTVTGVGGWGTMDRVERER